MFNSMKNLFRREAFMIGDREEGRVEYLKLRKRGDLAYEVEVQKQRIESKGHRVLGIIEYGEKSLIVYRCICCDVEAEDSAVFLRIIIITPKGVRYPEPRLDAVYFKNDALINIGDIKVFGQNINHGYGSILVKELIKISEKQGVKKVTGEISSVDWNHVDRLKHFYEKHGFKVTLDSGKKSGEIVLNIL
jgi:ribosomal protein S18 acetylase RimI-like enzyme